MKLSRIMIKQQLLCYRGPEEKNMIFSFSGTTRLPAVILMRGLCLFCRVGTNQHLEQGLSQELLTELKQWSLRMTPVLTYDCYKTDIVKKRDTAQRDITCNIMQICIILQVISKFVDRQR